MRNIQGVYLILCFFPRILESLPPLPHYHSAAIGCTNFQPIGVTVHSHCVENTLKVSYSDVGEGGVAVNSAKTQFFLNTLYQKEERFSWIEGRGR